MVDQGNTGTLSNPQLAGSGDLAGPTWANRIVTLYLLALLLPFILQLGGLRLSAYRILLLFATVPLLVLWLQGEAGQKRVADFAILGLCLWSVISFLVLHGPQVAVEAGGIFFVETAGAYFLGRCLVRTPGQFLTVARTLFFIVMLLMPFAIIEALTGRNIPLETMDKLWPSYDRVIKEPRWGMQRVQATFEHPILFGMFCGSVIGLAYMVVGHGRGLAKRLGLALATFFTAGFSLSSGPLTGMVTQLLMISWDSVLRNVKARWKILAVLTALAYAVIEIGSNRPASAVFISYFSFNEYSAYLRLHIWNFGMANVLEHPIFGLGFNDWERPYWLGASVDMFWIVFAMRHGFPAMFFTLLAFFAAYVPLWRKRDLSERVSNYRLGALFSLTAWFMTGWTVHFWNGTYVLFLFLIGSSLWVLDAKSEDETATDDFDAKKGTPRTIRYSRFAPVSKSSEHPPRALARTQQSGFSSRDEGKPLRRSPLSQESPGAVRSKK
ncbi:O-antigen ligase family protein [Vannielia litorea]|uniref:O-antigen ligase family protein n=1 Tax=Vannielia litorea TaxID=1217970 RepID=UPI001C974A17|nr:O-antigen ligase family protein [Vannielia litorea]MBY6049538.1 O-antigen ligase family protein [Vannielia litorea]MBY6076952.1 O-antigen ligase family protein [Vannielia litorea]